MSTWMVSSLPTSLKVIKVLIKKHYYCGILQFLTFQVALRWLKENRPNWPEDHWTSSRAENPNRCQTRLQTPTWENASASAFLYRRALTQPDLRACWQGPTHCCRKTLLSAGYFSQTRPFSDPLQKKQNNNLLFAVRGDLATMASQDDEEWSKDNRAQQCASAHSDMLKGRVT